MYGIVSMSLVYIDDYISQPKCVNTTQYNAVQSNTMTTCKYRHDSTASELMRNNKIKRGRCVC